jgi:DNA-binding MarR family transcriptional regulator
MDVNEAFVTAVREWMRVLMRRSMRAFVRYSRQSGLSVSQIGVMFRINDGRSSLADLSGGLGITSAAVSQMMDKLVQQGLILRSEDPNDRRTNQLTLTDKGRQVINESFHFRQAWLRDLADSLSAQEKQQVTAALHLLVQKANQLGPGAELEH